MGFFVENRDLNKDIIVSKYEGITETELFNKVNDILIDQGYHKLGVGNEHVLFEKGNYTRRILFGAFFKYYKMSVTTTTNEQGELLLIIKSAVSGITGGLIGIKQVEKEFIRISQLLQSL